jgi:cytochrome P450
MTCSSLSRDSMKPRFGARAGELPRRPWLDGVTAILFYVFTTGSDIIAITVEWAMTELLHNPGIMGKVRAEIKGILGSKETSIEEPDVAGLPYLPTVVEVMRLHPVAWNMLPHKAMEDGVKISGYAIHKGSTVIFNVWVIMRDVTVWERPNEFMPERWFWDIINEMDFRGKDFEFIPFRSDRRLCPGSSMAERIMPFVLTSVFHRFNQEKG